MLDVLGHPTWYEVRGSGDVTVLLLHGGMSNSDALLDSIGAPLAEGRRVAAFDRRGHGRTADTADAFHYEAMVDETIAVIEHLGAPVIERPQEASKPLTHPAALGGGDHCDRWQHVDR